MLQQAALKAAINPWARKNHLSPERWVTEYAGRWKHLPLLKAVGQVVCNVKRDQQPASS
jgi:hypothetical protein